MSERPPDTQRGPEAGRGAPDERDLAPNELVVDPDFPDDDNAPAEDRAKIVQPGDLPPG